MEDVDELTESDPIYGLIPRETGSDPDAERERVKIGRRTLGDETRTPNAARVKKATKP